MNPFDKFGIERLSYSAIDLWASNPLLYCLRYLAKMPSDVGASAWRGTAVGVGLADFLRRGNQEAALEMALDKFDQEAKGRMDAKGDKERGLIPAFLETAIAHIGPDVPTLTESEYRIDYEIAGLEVPLIGYVDLRFDGRPFIELKSTLRMPSAPADNHTGQVALYSDALKEDGELMYVTDKRAVTFPIGDNTKAHALAKLRRNALSLQKFLSRVSDVKDAIQSLPINSSDFKWSTAAETKLEEYA